jgi:hypothetical protein
MCVIHATLEKTVHAATIFRYHVWCEQREIKDPWCGSWLLNRAQIETVAKAIDREFQRQMAERGRKELDVDLVARSALAALEARAGTAAGIEPERDWRETLAAGDIVQIRAVPGAKYGGALVVVTEPRGFGVTGYITGEGRFFVRCEWSEIEPTGGKATGWEAA